MSPRGRSLGTGLLVLGLAACGTDDASPPTGGPPPGRPTVPETYRPSGHAAAGDVSIHLFEWRWDDIATECEQVLAPAGVKAVQVSPPQEHSITPNHDWSERYQPVSYSVERSRSGTGAQFREMLQRCNAVGVDIYVDAVLNHMTNFPSPGTGSNGTEYTKYSYPGLYNASDFHSPCTVTNYGSAANVQDCELLSLPDLRTEKASVRQALVDYLVGLARMGVAGFRVDAAKHIQQGDLDAIVDSVNLRLQREARPLPYWFLEVIAGTGEAIGESDYYGIGYRSGGAADITEFTFTGVASKFRQLNGEALADLNPDGPPGHRFSAEAWGMMPSPKAVVFLQNHDTQHQCGLDYRTPQVYRMAHVWMLAQPYGYPSILSSYVYNCPAQNALGPPSDPDGWTLPVQCAPSMETAAPGQWVCEHRDPALLGMIGFRRRVAGAPVTRWWDNGGDAIAFSRGGAGFVALNRDTAIHDTIDTGLAPGTYCDLLTGGRDGSSCLGTAVEVRPDSTVILTLGHNAMLAIDTSTILSNSVRGTAH